MEEKQIMMDILSTEKGITNNTLIAIHEASSEIMFNLYSDILNKLTKEVKEIWGLCYSNNWYQLEEAQQSKIDQEITKLCGELNKEE